MSALQRHLKTRLGVFRPSTGEWLGKSTALSDWSVGGADVIIWGLPGDVPVPADYFGEGLQQVAVFRPSEGYWYIKSSRGGTNVIVQCGREGDIPVPLDYFGEGKPRIAVFRPSNGTWHIKGPGLSDWENSQGNIIVQCGQPGDVPIPADFFGEGKPRIAVFRPTEGALEFRKSFLSSGLRGTGKWLIKGPNSSTNWNVSVDNVEVIFGKAGDIPVPANYFNEKAANLLGWDGPDGKPNPGNITIKFGNQGDIPVPGDFFGEKLIRLAVWRPSDGTWYVKGYGGQDFDKVDQNSTVPLFRNLTFKLGERGDIQVARDYTGQGYLKFATFRQSTGAWYISARPNVTLKFGQKGDIPVAADYENALGETFAVYRPSEGKWYIKGEGDTEWDHSVNNWEIKFGKPDDIPVPMDFFGDGNDRIAMFSPSDGVYRVKPHGREDWDEKTGVTVDVEAKPGDIPVPRDYFGTNNPCFAFFRPSNASWYIKSAGTQSWNDSPGSVIIQCGTEGDIPIPYDYFDEGHVRLAVFRPSTGQWFIKGPGIQDWDKCPGNIVIQSGEPGDIPLPFDYFGEETPRLATWRPSNGNWYIKGPGWFDWASSTGNIVLQCGQDGDIPLRNLPFSGAITK